MKKVVLICGLALSFVVLAGCAKNTQDQTGSTTSVSAPAGHDYKGEVGKKK